MQRAHLFSWHKLLLPGPVWEGSLPEVLSPSASSPWQWMTGTHHSLPPPWGCSLVHASSIFVSWLVSTPTLPSRIYTSDHTYQTEHPYMLTPIMPFFCSKPTSILSYSDKKPKSVCAYPTSPTSILLSFPRSLYLPLPFLDCAHGAHLRTFVLASLTPVNSLPYGQYCSLQVSTSNVIVSAMPALVTTLLKVRHCGSCMVISVPHVCLSP